MSYFGLRKWEFSNRNIVKLNSVVEKSRYLRDTLQFDCTTVNWPDFFSNYIPGVQKYYYKITNPQIHAKCRRVYRRFKFYHDSIKIIFWCLLPILCSYKGRRFIQKYLQRLALQ